MGKESSAKQHKLEQIRKAKKKKVIMISSIVGTVFAAAILLLVISIIHHNNQKKNTASGIDVSGKETGYSNEVVLGDYMGLTYTPVEVSVSDEDVEEYIDSLLKNTPNYEPDYSKDKMQPVAGETVEITFSALATDEVANAVTDETRLVTIGNGLFGSEFDEMITDVTVGGTFQFLVNVPEDCEYEKLAGKEVKFTGTLNMVVILYDTVTDSYASEQSNGECTEATEFNNYVYNLLYERAQKQADENKWNQIWNELLSNCEITIDEANVDAEYQDMISYYESYATYLGTTVDKLATEAYGYSTLQDFYDYCKTYSENIVKEQAVYNAIIAKEGISVKAGDEVYNTKVQKYMEEGGYKSIADIEKVMGQEALIEMVEDDLVSELLLSNAVPKEE